MVLRLPAAVRLLENTLLSTLLVKVTILMRLEVQQMKKKINNFKNRKSISLFMKQQKHQQKQKQQGQKKKQHGP
jgi:hypothetical protein